GRGGAPARAARPPAPAPPPPGGGSVRDFDPEQVIGLAVVSNDFSFAPAVVAADDEAADAEDYVDVEVAAGVDVDDDDDFDEAALIFDDADFGSSGFEEDEDEEFDELSIEELFLNVTAMWSVLGAI